MYQTNWKITSWLPFNCPLKAHLHDDENAVFFGVRLAGFMNKIKLSLETKWPRLTLKHRVLSSCKWALSCQTLFFWCHILARAGSWALSTAIKLIFSISRYFELEILRSFWKYYTISKQKWFFEIVITLRLISHHFKTKMFFRNSNNFAFKRCPTRNT